MTEERTTRTHGGAWSWIAPGLAVSWATAGASSWWLLDGSARVGVSTITGLSVVLAAGAAAGVAWACWASGKMRVPSMVSRGLRRASRGDDSQASLAVHDSLGDEARAWNRILSERETARRGSVEGMLEDRRGVGEASGSVGTGALDTLWLGVLLLDAGQRVVYANGAAAVSLRYKREELIGKPASVVLAGEELGTLLTGLATGTLKHKQSVDVNGTGDAATVLRVSVKPTRKGDEAAAVVLIEDVTQAREAEKSRNGLVAQASHELRTPLTNIRLYVEALLEDDGQDNPAARATAINTINQEARRLERIVADMLSVSEMEAGSFRLRVDDVPVGQMVEDLRHDFEPQAADKEITLAFELSPKLPRIRGDRDKLTLALHNLVGNALKYTPAGGTVTLRAQVTGEGTAEERLVFEVVDTGIGIRPEEQDLVFDRFYRAKDKRIAGITGTGLGLTLSREVARLHGGDVTLRSEVDKGSTFVLVVPTGVMQAGHLRAA